MTTGDIHNSSGSICKASKVPCPLGEEGHSKDVDSFVDHHVRESGVDGDAVRAMIADGTPLGDAVEVAKSGLSTTGSSLSKEQEAYEDEIDEETFGHIQNLKGAERAEAIAEAEANLSDEYAQGRDEAEFEGESIEELNQVYRNRLAAIHGVSKDKVTNNGYGDIQISTEEGPVLYNGNFELKKSSQQDREGRWSGMPNDMSNAERELGEKVLMADYQSARSSVNAITDQKLKKSEMAALQKETRAKLAEFHGTSPLRVSADWVGGFSVNGKNRVVSIYGSDMAAKYWSQSG